MTVHTCDNQEINLSRKDLVLCVSEEKIWPGCSLFGKKVPLFPGEHLSPGDIAVFEVDGLRNLFILVVCGVSERQEAEIIIELALDTLERDPDSPESCILLGQNVVGEQVSPLWSKIIDSFESSRISFYVEDGYRLPQDEQPLTLLRYHKQHRTVSTCVVV